MTRLLLIILFLTTCATTMAEVDQRFPPPDFGPEYVYPHSDQASPRAGWWNWIDTGVLLAALALAAWFALGLRSRRAMFWLTLFSLVYFGFFRKGCVCPIGSIQNVTQALFDSSHILPWSVMAFFLMPLVFAIFFGRVFCAGVCPLGALQDLALVKARRVPVWLDRGLDILRYFYLGLAVLFAAAGARYVICQYDPFVSFFRLSARFHIWVLSASFLLLSTFIGRPYCRWLCPYGVILGFLSRFSYRKVTITPAECVVCGLCQDACPFGAIQEGANPAAEEPVK